MGVSHHGWFVIENPPELDDNLRYPPHFRKPPCYKTTVFMGLSPTIITSWLRKGLPVYHKKNIAFTQVDKRNLYNCHKPHGEFE